MKYFILKSALILILGATLSACDKEPKTISTNTGTNNITPPTISDPAVAKLAGKWRGTDGDDTLTAEFKTDGTYIDQGNVKYTTTYTLTNNTIHFNGECNLLNLWNNDFTISYNSPTKMTWTNTTMNKWGVKWVWTKISNDSADNNQSGSGNNNTKIPYENYIHYRYNQTSNYYHEIKLVKQAVELASSGTIHGWNYKYLNFYIGKSNLKVGFQFESTYYNDEYPPTTKWPAMKYDIISTSANAITHYPIARVIVYDESMSKKTMYTTVGKGEIKYVGNKLIFDFTSNEKNPDYYVDIHFEGSLSY